MDKIKILAAVLALAGCMENGMGMQENIEINNGNVILRSADTSEWNDKIEAAGFPKLKSIELRGIDFDECSDLSGLNAVISMFDDVIFAECKYMPARIDGLHHVANVEFVNCANSLDGVCMIIYRTCNFDYLKSFTYINDQQNMKNKGVGYMRLTDTFKYTNVYVN